MQGRKLNIEYFHGRLGYYLTRKKKRFTEDPYLGLYVCSSAIFDPPYSTRPYILGNEREKKK